MVVSEITTGDHSECTDGRQRAHLRAAQRVFAIAVANDLAIEPARQVEFPREHVSRVVTPARPPLVVAMARIGIGLVARPTAKVRTSVIIATPLVAVARVEQMFAERPAATVTKIGPRPGLMSFVIAILVAIIAFAGIIDIAWVQIKHGHLHRRVQSRCPRNSSKRRLSGANPDPARGQIGDNRS